MDLPDQAHRDRERGQTPKPQIHGGNVVDHFIHVARSRVGAKQMGLGSQQILQGTLRTFDLAGQYGFLSDVHENKQIRVGQRLDGAIQTSDGTVRLRKKGL